jgi:hypothetical protein
LRQYFVAALRCKDWQVALVEDAITIWGASWVLQHF